MTKKAIIYCRTSTEKDPGDFNSLNYRRKFFREQLSKAVKRSVLAKASEKTTQSN